MSEWTSQRGSSLSESNGYSTVKLVIALSSLTITVYRQSWTSYTVGYAAAIGVIMLVLLMIYFVIYIRIFERQEGNR